MRTVPTPGPWKAIEMDRYYYKVDGPVFKGKSVYLNYAADAYLIAAAPEMLAALENIVDAINGRGGGGHGGFVDDDDDEYLDAVKAITKARGEE